MVPIEAPIHKYFSEPQNYNPVDEFCSWVRLSVLAIVSIVVPFGGYLITYRILIIYLLKPKKGTTMETIGKSHDPTP